MGKANLYTVKDYQTGEVLAKGTAGELEASGIVPKGYHTSEWAKHENQKRRNRKYAISFEERQPEVKRGGKAGKTMRAPCKDCPKRRPLCHDRCETYRRWKEEKAKETAHTKQKREDAVIYRKDFDKEFWM